MKVAVVFAAAALMPASLAAQQAGPCAGPEHRQFDFWLGYWDVIDASTNQKAGENTITRAFGGCVIEERYTTARGYSGASLNIYDASRGVWHQTWVDVTGLLLVIEGGMVDGSMVMTGPGKDQNGNEILNRITWTPMEGSLRQHWEVSSDSGATWTTAFDGIYRRRA